MKRGANWDDAYTLSSDSSSDEENESGGAKRGNGKAVTGVSRYVMSEVNSAKKKAGAIDYEALTKHGYKSGPSVLNVPPPREVNEKEPDWSWSTGKEQAVVNKGTEESFEERQKTRAAVTQGELLTTALTSKEKKNMSFSQKEKRKRELGQASRGKNYVEEEKRLLRESGIYSGFDS
ncbi:hypothetical protein H6P81_004852 [Aristolochia fimbriata]|uniref:Uncharacterized protein n=1 Tax=Aristolochia fimbriata TaxID=158543 RepID=A0AAV7ETB7_ARIFI|nr:hypothetical protein H6P81_004852 [Aristolochia fimbriata]